MQVLEDEKNLGCVKSSYVEIKACHRTQVGEHFTARNELEHHVNVFVVLERAMKVDNIWMLYKTQDFDLRLDVLCLVELDNALL